MALVMMGLLFLLKERIFRQREHPMLSMLDLRLLMQALLNGNRELLHRRHSRGTGGSSNARKTSNDDEGRIGNVAK